MAQALDNLLRNAMEAMPQGGVIQVGAENVAAGFAVPSSLSAGEYVRVYVKDAGGGIAPQNISKVFDPFFSTKHGGHGLGLSIVYSIINKHGGSVEVKSEVGKGAVFYLYLPADRRGCEEAETEHPARSLKAGKILLMDDEDFIREIGSDLLKELGYVVECAADGEEAVRLYRLAREKHEPFDAVILDLTVRNGMSGKDAVHELVKIDPSVRALVSSGYANDPVLADPLQYGFKRAVPKPYSSGELSAALDQVLGA